MDTVSLLGVGSIPLIVGLVQVAKPFLPAAPDGRRWYPIVALILGITVNVLVGALVAEPPATWRVLGVDALQGVVAGLGAVGLYSATKQFLVPVSPGA